MPALSTAAAAAAAALIEFVCMAAIGAADKLHQKLQLDGPYSAVLFLPFGLPYFCLSTFLKLRFYVGFGREKLLFFFLNVLILCYNL